MTVQYIKNYDTSGANTIPATLNANTIYVLDAGKYITSNPVTFNASCIAFVAKRTAYIYSDQIFPSLGMLRTNTHNNLIVDNISLDGLKDGLGGIRSSGVLASGNYYGMYFYNFKNSTIHALQAHNTRYGIDLESANNVTLSNSLSYTNRIGGIYMYL